MKQKQRLVALAQRHEWLTLAGILVFFTGVTMGNVARWSIWFDEAFSAYIVRFDLAKIAYFTANDVHPPLYYWLLKGWTLLFGTDVAVMRTLSIVLGAVGLIGLYMILRWVTKSKGYALLATTAASLTPVLIRFSDEMRMYTMVFAIVMWATYCLLQAQKTGKRAWWAGYGVLVMLGMLTHYFTALAWLAHWAWRWNEVRSGRVKKFFARSWVVTFAVAIALYAWWIPAAVKQFTTVQSGGFWIPSITAQTPINYLTETLSYREGSETEGWWALLLLATITLVGWVVVRALPQMRQQFRAEGLSMVVFLALLPPALLFIGSLPPLKSSFIGRYVLYAQVMLIVLMVLALAVLRGQRRTVVLAVSVLMTVCLIVGVGHVYTLGNYNKVTHTSIRTGEVVKQIQQAGEAGQPVIAASQWLYYEAAAYDSAAHPVYYNAENMKYYYGSELMLKEDDAGKIRSLSDFAGQHRYVWYFNATSDQLNPPIASWKLIKSVSVYDSIDDVTNYKAGLYDTQAK